MGFVAAPVRAVAAFELRRLARSPGAWLGVLAFVALLGVGHWSYWTALPPRPADDRLFGWGYILAMCGILRFGFAEDRELVLDEFLVANLVTPARYALGKLVAVAAVLAVFGAGAFLWACLLGAGDAAYAMWYTALFTLVALLFLPAVALVELAIDTRYPAAFVFVAFVAVLVIGHAVAGPAVVVAALGLDVERLIYASLLPLAGRVLVSAWLLLLLYPLCRLRLVGRAGWSWAGA
ncbi:MAG TPA: hypothetical protein VF212_12170 [Longimicrobiales bacterium]